MWEESMWEESNVGGFQFWRNPMWEASNVGGIQCGRNPMWEESYDGGNPSRRDVELIVSVKSNSTAQSQPRVTVQSPY